MKKIVLRLRNKDAAKTLKEIERAASDVHVTAMAGSRTLSTDLPAYFFKVKGILIPILKFAKLFTSSSTDAIIDSIIETLESIPNPVPPEQ